MTNPMTHSHINTCPCHPSQDHSASPGAAAMASVHYSKPLLAHRRVETHNSCLVMMTGITSTRINNAHGKYTSLQALLPPVGLGIRRRHSTHQTPRMECQVNPPPVWNGFFFPKKRGLGLLLFFGRQRNREIDREIWALDVFLELQRSDVTQ